MLNFFVLYLQNTSKPIEMLDRTLAPEAHQLSEFHILKAESHMLDNGLKCHTILAGEQPVVKLELVFAAGSKLDTQKGQSFFTSKLLIEGTKNRSSKEIHEYFDQFGAFTQISQNADFATITLYSLSHHLKSVLPVLQEMLTESIFSKHELGIQKNIAIQNLQVNLEKTAFVSSQLLREKIFGTTHPYGKSLTIADIQQIEQQPIIDFYENYIKNQPFEVFLSGSFGETELTLINTYLGNITINENRSEKASLITTSIKNEAFLLEKPDNMQSSIRLGRQLFNRKHPDYFKFIVTNTLFGGYFGSRLMKNIREDKGFTYGISSSLVPMAHEGYFVIGTDVKKEFTQQTIDEIAKEISILQTQEVSEKELSNVKNYMIGAFAGSLNTPFEIADRQKIIILDQLDSNFYENYIQKINQISAQDIMEIANKYLSMSDLTEVVVGGK